MKRLGRGDQPGPVGAVEQPAAIGVVGHEHVHAPRHEFFFPALGWLGGHEARMPERLAHHGLHEGAALHGDLHARLVDVRPGLHGLIALGGHTVDVAAQIRLREAQLLLALGKDAHGEHGDIAARLQQVRYQPGKGGVHILHPHAQVLGQLHRELRIDARQPACARVTEGDAVVVGPYAHTKGARGCNPLQHLASCGRAGPWHQTQQQSGSGCQTGQHAPLRRCAETGR